MFAEPTENTAADGVIVNEPTTFGTAVLAGYEALEWVYVRPEIASAPTRPPVSAYENVGSAPFTVFDLSSALMMIGFGSIVTDCWTGVAAA